MRPRWPSGGGDGRTEGRKDGRKDGRMEIPPCVLQDIGPLGPLPKKHLKRLFFDFLTLYGLKDGQADRRTKLLIELHVCNY